jgi:hypothetical protein
MVDGVKNEDPFGGNSGTVTIVVWCRPLGWDCYLKGRITVEKVRYGRGIYTNKLALLHHGQA